jgi:hypothetical protein
MNQGLEEFINETGLQAVPLPIVIGRIVRIILSFLGLIAIIIIVYGGILWMTSGGSPDKISKAKKIMINGLIGLLIIVLAFAIASFILYLLGQITGTGTGGGPGGPGGGGGTLPDGASYLVVTDKYPTPGEDAPRNSSVIVTFNYALNCETVKLCTGPNQPDGCTVSVMQGSNYIKGTLKAQNNTFIFKTDTACPPPLAALSCQLSNSCPGTGDPTSSVCPVGTASSEQCEAIPPHTPPYSSLSCCRGGAYCCNCFGPGSYNINLVSGDNGIKAANGKVMRDDDSWQVDIADILDTTPPEVIVNLPPNGSTAPINTGIAVTFSKPVDLSTLKTYDQQVNNIAEATVQVRDNDGPVAGYFERLTTTSFIFRPNQNCDPPNQGCHCFGKNKTISVSLKNDANLGIRDTSCNLLNCDNGRCDWTFRTSSSVDTTPPTVNSTNPQNAAENISRQTNIDSIFDENIDPTSVNYDTFQVSDTVAREITSSDNLQFTFKPYSILDAFRRYDAIVFGGGQPGGSCNGNPDLLWGVRDLAGNAMVNNYTWSFTTGGLVNNGDPYIDWVSPTSGPYGRCVTIHGYNLGCAIGSSAQNNSWDDVSGNCQVKSNIGKTEFYNTSNGWTSADILKWDELNRPTECTPGKDCPANCNNTNCDPNTCQTCIYSSNPNPPCQCPFPTLFSPENQIIVTVPTTATTSPTVKEIRVTPAH